MITHSSFTYYLIFPLWELRGASVHNFCFDIPKTNLLYSPVGDYRAEKRIS